MSEFAIAKGPEADEVQMSLALLTFFLMMRDAKQLFIHERMVAEELNLPEPGDHVSRCSTMFYQTHAEMATRLGLKLNAITFEGIMWLNIDPALSRMEAEALQEFVFNPWAGQGRGGIYKKA